MKNESITLWYAENAKRRQVSKKPPMTMSFNQSRKAEKENSSATSEERSVGIASGEGAGAAGVVPFMALGIVELGSLALTIKPERTCCANKR